MPFRHPIRGPPRLNYDILFNVLYHAAQQAPSQGLSTVSRMMRTCHVLYSEGAKTILLAPWCITVSEPNAASFSLFLLAENGARLPYVKSFRLPSFEGAQLCFGRFLPRMTTLTTLILPHKPDSSPWDPEFYQTTINLTSLRCLSLDRPDISTLRMVACMRFPLHTLQVNHTCPNMQPSTLADAPAPGSALSSLEILWFHLVPVPPDISWWLQCCPKVAILRILSGGSPDAARTLRRTNRGALTERSPGGWPSLVHVGGTISDVFSLGLSQQVPKVTISFVGDTWPPLEQLGMVQAVLCDTEPESLVLDLYFPEEGSDNEQVEEAFSLGGVFRHAFEGPGVGRLRRLKILQRFESEVQTLALDALVRAYTGRSSSSLSFALKSIIS